MSDRVTADLDAAAGGAFAPVLYHSGDAAAPLDRWRHLLRAAWRRGRNPAREYAGNVMDLVASPRVLFVAAQALRARGAKAPGPDGLRLEVLSRTELWALCTALGRAIAAGTYRPGPERVVWAAKASGRGSRPIVLMGVADRVVQRAAAMVLRPLVDPLLDPLSFAFRPGRGRDQAVAVARRLALDGHSVWLTHDLRDAFRRVPVPRLLDAVSTLVPCARLRAFLGLVLPPRSRRVGGIKQGGPLSPLALEMYLCHVLDRPWRRSGEGARLVRYADDLLVVCRTTDEAARADALLRRLTIPAGMAVRDAPADALTDLRRGEAQWLGFRFCLAAGRLEIRPGSGALAQLGGRFMLAHAMSQPAARAAGVIRHWVGQLGPCHRWADRDDVCGRALDVAREHAFEELPPVGELTDLWAASAARWRRTCRTVRRDSAYLRPGPIVPPCPTAAIR